METKEQHTVAFRTCLTARTCTKKAPVYIISTAQARCQLRHRTSAWASLQRYTPNTTHEETPQRVPGTQQNTQTNTANTQSGRGCAARVTCNHSANIDALSLDLGIIGQINPLPRSLFEHAPRLSQRLNRHAACPDLLLVL
eukprot:2762237-Rhodomonas_salina.2